MDFYEELSKIGKTDVLYSPNFKMPVFFQEEKIMEALMEIIRENKRVFIYGDYDADGAYSVECLKETFNYLGHDNYECFRYSSRTHNVDITAVNKAITENFEYMIICDAGSSDPDLMGRLHMMGVKVILLDHHQSVFSYKDFPHTLMINTSFENRERDDEIIVSAGALTFLVCEKLIERFNRPKLESLTALALCSLYADVIDMTSDTCRHIYYRAMALSKSSLPKLIQRFMGQYDTFTRRFIEYRLNPKINSLFRSERFDLLNLLLNWTPESNISIYDIVQKVDEVYSKDRDEVAKASDILEHEVLNHFVIGNLSSVGDAIDIPEHKIHNYTGLVANRLASKYNKTAIVYADTGVDVKGSLRDLYGRNYLDLFKQFSNSKGHNSAFGIHINYLEFSEVISYIKMIDQQFFINTISNEPIIVPHNLVIPDTTLVNHMSLYNEFSGVGSPTAFISKVWLDTRRPYNNSSYYYKYPWGPYKVKTPNPIRVGSEILIKPYKGWPTAKNGGTELLVSEVTR